MITKEQMLDLEQELISLAEKHKAEYSNQMRDYEDAPFFAIYKHNVPVLADIRMLAEKYGVQDAVCSEPSWGYVALEF